MRHGGGTAVDVWLHVFSPAQLLVGCQQRALPYRVHQTGPPAGTFKRHGQARQTIASPRASGRASPLGVKFGPRVCIWKRKIRLFQFGEFLRLQAGGWTSAKAGQDFGLRRHDAALLRRDASRRRKRGHVRAVQKRSRSLAKGQTPRPSGGARRRPRSAITESFENARRGRAWRSFNSRRPFSARIPHHTALQPAHRDFATGHFRPCAGCGRAWTRRGRRARLCAVANSG